MRQGKGPPGAEREMSQSSFWILVREYKILTEARPSVKTTDVSYLRSGTKLDPE